MQLTRGSLKDRIRRKLLRLPQSDVSLNPAQSGQDASVGWPSDALLNQAVEEAIAYLNAFSRLGPVVQSGPYTIQGVGVSWRGPLFVELDRLTEGTGTATLVIEAWWVDNAGNTTRLEPYTYRREEMGEKKTASGSIPFGDGRPWPVPRCYYQFGSHLGLFPAPNQTGSLMLTWLSPLPYLQSDSDVLLLAGEWVPLLVDVAVRTVAQTNPTNVEMEALAQSLEPTITLLTRRLIAYMADLGSAFSSPFLMSLQGQGNANDQSAQ